MRFEVFEAISPLDQNKVYKIRDVVKGTLPQEYVTKKAAEKAAKKLHNRYCQLMGIKQEN